MHRTHLNHNGSVAGHSAAFGILNLPAKFPSKNITSIRSCFTGRQTLIRFSRRSNTSVNEFRSRDTSSVCELVLPELGCICRINAGAGRDHCAQNACAIMAGGGLKTGQQIGTTDPYAEAPIDRPVHFNEVFSTRYRNLEIRPDQITLTDLSGRPRYLLDDYRPIPEAI